MCVMCVVPDVQVCRSWQMMVVAYCTCMCHAAHAHSPLTFLLYDDTVCMLFRRLCPNVSVSSLQ